MRPTGSTRTLARAFPILVGLGVVFALIRVVPHRAHHPQPAGRRHPEYLCSRCRRPRCRGSSAGSPSAAPSRATSSSTPRPQAFAVVGILGAFGVFNAVASHHELVQAAPRAFHEPGLILTVSLAFVPSTMAAVADAREADRARTGGRVVRRGRLVRLTVPDPGVGPRAGGVAWPSRWTRAASPAGPRGRGDRASAWLGLVGAAGPRRRVRGPRRPGHRGGRGRRRRRDRRPRRWRCVLASRSAGTSRYRPRKLTRLDVAVGAGRAARPDRPGAHLAASGDHDARTGPPARCASRRSPSGRRCAWPPSPSPCWCRRCRSPAPRSSPSTSPTPSARRPRPVPDDAPPSTATVTWTGGRRSPTPTAPPALGRLDLEVAAG